MPELRQSDLKKIYEDKRVELRRNELKFEADKVLDLFKKPLFSSLSDCICKLKTRGDVKKLGGNIDVNTYGD